MRQGCGLVLCVLFTFGAFGFACLSACALDSSPTIGQVDEPIINGTDDGGRDPSVVFLTADLGGGSFYYCTATMITPRIAITAAHCVGVSGATNFHVEFFDTWMIDTGVKTGVVDASNRRVVRTWADPAFNEGEIQLGHDVALVLLDSAVSSAVPPVPFYRGRLNQQNIGASDRVVGFGRRMDGNDRFVKRQFASTPITGLVNQSINLANRTSSTCNGDSGGPHLITVNGVETIVGVTSFGNSLECAGTSFNQRTDVDLPQILDFIATNDPQPTANCGADGICGWDCPEIDPDCPCILDGRCDVACTVLDSDPDCPTSCDDDGVCQRTGCPRPDPDCGTAAVGESCTINQNCASDLCVVDGSGHVCSQSCGAGGSCPAGFSCKASSQICQPETDGGGGGGCAVGGGSSGLSVALAALVLALRRRRHVA